MHHFSDLSIIFPSIISEYTIFTYFADIYPNALQTECLENLDSFMLVIRTVCEELCDGKINIHNLENICAEEVHFKIILQEMKDLPIDKDTVIESISLRRKQLDCYKSDLEVVQHFVYVCRNCGGRLSWLCRL